MLAEEAGAGNPNLVGTAETRLQCEVLHAHGGLCWHQLAVPGRLPRGLTVL